MAPLTIALAGIVSLGVAMGIGRFAFTPLLPLMLAEGSLDLAGGSLLASANYVGYLVGALACTFQPWIWRRIGLSGGVDGPKLVRAGLIATVLLTLGMALHLPRAWVLLRFAAGVVSGVVFVYTSGFCLEQLARRGKPAMGALIYTGPGLGIIASGLAATAMVQLHAPASAGWLVFGLLAAVLTVAVWRVFDARRAVPAAVAPGTGSGMALPAVEGSTGEIALLTIAYGLAGVGYIISATFLPVIARQALPGSHWADVFWPVAGLGVVLGALGASRLNPAVDLRWRLVGAYVVQAIGVAASVVSPTVVGFAIGSLFLGLPLTAITFFAMQEVRRVRPRDATMFMGLLTACYGLGQIIGPPFAVWMVARSADAGKGFDLSLWIACGLLLAGALVYVLVARRYPVTRRA